MKEKLRSLQEAEIQDETELMDKIQACTSDITQITQMATLQLNVSLIDLKGLIMVMSHALAGYQEQNKPADAGSCTD